MRFSILLSLVVITASTTSAQENAPGLADRVKSLEETVASLVTTQEATLRTQTDAMERFLGELDRLKALVNELDEKVSQIATSDGDRYIPDLSAMAVSRRLREEVFGATSGTFEVNNEMGTWMRIHVNGARWRFPPGVSSIRIPYGPVEARIVGGGDRIDFSQQDWAFQNGQHILRMRITNNIPQPD